jgi:hypothetical protein
MITGASRVRQAVRLSDAEYDQYRIGTLELSEPMSLMEEY